MSIASFRDFLATRQLRIPANFEEQIKPINACFCGSAGEIYRLLEASPYFFWLPHNCENEAEAWSWYIQRTQRWRAASLPFVADVYHNGFGGGFAGNVFCFRDVRRHVRIAVEMKLRFG